MRSLYCWLLICFAAVLFAPEVARGATHDGIAVVQADGVEVAGLFRRIFDGKRCGPDGCPQPEPDVPDDPPPVKVEPVEPKPEPVEPEPELPAWMFVALLVAGGVVTLILIIKRERG